MMTETSSFLTKTESFVPAKKCIVLEFLAPTSNLICRFLDETSTSKDQKKWNQTPQRPRRSKKFRSKSKSKSLKSHLKRLHIMLLTSYG